MTFKKEERKITEYVREEVSNSLPDLSSETLENALKQLDEKTKSVIDEVHTELQMQEAGNIVFNKYEALKYRFVTMFVSGMYSKRQIAHILGITPGTVTQWLSKPEVTAAIRDYQEKETFVVDATMKALRSKAMQRASELLDADNEMVQAIMVRDILDRTGHKPVEKKEVAVTMTYEERLRALADVDYTVREEVINDNGTDVQINTEGEVK